MLGVDRFLPGHDRGSSHGKTRIIRQAYFEHPDYVPLVQRAFELWAGLEARLGRKLYHEIGLLEVGPPDGPVIQGILESARRHRLPVESLTAEEAQGRFPGFHVPEGHVGVYEQRAGYLLVEACVLAHLDAACSAGAQLKTEAEVQGWKPDGNGVLVETTAGRYSADRLVVTAGPWAAELLNDLGIRFEIRRKPQFWIASDDVRYEAAAGCPAFFFETGDGVYYGFPKLDDWGVKVAEHSGGASVADPLILNRGPWPEDEVRIREFLGRCLPGVRGEVTHHSVCMYTMTPDSHFIVDRHPEHPQVVFAAGLSGHGFKFTPVLGEVLADLALEGETRQPVGFLSVNRF